MTERIVVADAPELVRQAAEWLITELTRAITERGACAVALAGGRTPQPVYRALAAAGDVDWNRVDVFFGDERAVPPDHPESNFRMVQEALLAHVPIPAKRVHRMEAERTDRDAAARDYERALPARLDVVLLGMGPDGHTASLFPRSPALAERRLVVPVVAPKPPPERLTITPIVIQAAREVGMMATGADKAAMVARATEGPLAVAEVPAQLARRGTWFLDEAAAGQLTVRRVAR